METVQLESFLPLPDGDRQYPIEFIESRGAIKLKEDEDTVHVGLSESADDGVESVIRKYHRKRVVFCRIEQLSLSAYLGKRLAENGPTTEDSAGKGERLDERLLLDKLANDAPIVNLVNSIFMDAIRAGASDIHIEASPDSARVRYRVDGALKTVRSIERERFAAVASRVKIMGNLNILERRLPQDGRITVSLGGQKTDLRVSIVPVAGGESIVLRILGRTSTLVALDDLGFEPDQLRTLRRLFTVPHGLLLVTGPTGCGKTTTLNAMIREIASDSLKIVTIEDPVEFVIDGVNQIQTNEQIKLGFDTILRRVLRQDPNVIMVGEIRDGATAELAVRAALTGHLVLSTLHTNDAASVIPRLANMGVERYLIASVLRGAVAQRLVRRSCPACAALRQATAPERRLFERAGVAVSGIRESSGCPECDGTGYRGRTLIAEAFATDPEVEEAVIRGDRASEIAELLRTKGMRTMIQDGLAKAAAGVTSLAEIGREIVLDEGRI